MARFYDFFAFGILDANQTKLLTPAGHVMLIYVLIIFIDMIAVHQISRQSLSKPRSVNSNKAECRHVVFRSSTADPFSVFLRPQHNHVIQHHPLRVVNRLFSAIFLHLGTSATVNFYILISLKSIRARILYFQ